MIIKMVGCFCGCGRTRGHGTRGLSYSCHRKLQRLVAKGETNWDELERKGKIKPREQRGLTWRKYPVLLPRGVSA